jgi:hypothetical protein
MTGLVVELAPDYTTLQTWLPLYVPQRETLTDPRRSSPIANALNPNGLLVKEGRGAQPLAAIHSGSASSEPPLL